MNLILWITAFVGHLGSWCVVYNRTHATNWRRVLRKRCEKLVIAAVLIPFFWFVGRVIGLQTLSFWDVASNSQVEWIYLCSMLGLGVFFTARWAWRKFKAAPERNPFEPTHTGKRAA